jgi:flagellar basal-body rod protein FlgC
MFKVFDIAGSALSAQSLRLNTTASNLANADSISSSTEQTYRARQPVFAAELTEAQEAVGVQVRGIVESQAPLREEYRPDHPMANENGYVFLPNVNAVEEMTNMISASRAYQSNVEVINTAKQLMLKTLTLGQ